MADEDEVEGGKLVHPADVSGAAAAELEEAAGELPAARGFGDGVWAEVDAEPRG